MVSNLYWISSLTYAIVLGIIFVHDILINRKAVEKVEKSFRTMLVWVIYFCIQDVFWGLCDNHIIPDDRVFFAASTIFHLSTVITTFFWLSYVLIYLGERVKHSKLYRIMDGIVIAFQVILLTANFFTPTIFRIENGIYTTAWFRPIAFLNQYIVYVVIGVVTLACALKEKEENRKRFLSVFCFAIAPILSGGFQYLYPDDPFYSMGYFLGCFIVHMFVVSEDRERATQADLLIKSNTDGLTGFFNRRFYEDNIREYKDTASEDTFVYVSMDVNGLKTVNDTLGHAAGDELIVGAAECMKRCFGAYGRLYRTGGDEFAAIIFVSPEQLTEIKHDFDETTANWKGNFVDGISVSCGYVSKWEVHTTSVRKIAAIADEKMYEEKAKYYNTKGIDRRGQRDAQAAICALYTKILKANFTKDTYQIVNMDTTEQTEAHGFSSVLSTWLSEFGKSGNVHPDDLSEYLQKTDRSYVQNFFKEGNQSLCVFYRRKYGDSYRRVIMEMIPANDYNLVNQTVFMYVREI